ncbi:hypothetical protein [Ferrimicrobium acidiphilum]|uniref:hypothetical protein n=1 Tax=Ferrimicrobium acidiphilum TaxID=121039 RepID=UPI0023F352F3|nr:hypothetical protein [Ferrimicrobium acidiphilum]
MTVSTMTSEDLDTYTEGATNDEIPDRESDGMDDDAEGSDDFQAPEVGGARASSGKETSTSKAAIQTRLCNEYVRLCHLQNISGGSINYDDVQAELSATNKQLATTGLTAPKIIALTKKKVTLEEKLKIAINPVAFEEAKEAFLAVGKSYCTKQSISAAMLTMMGIPEDVQKAIGITPSDG